MTRPILIAALFLAGCERRVKTTALSDDSLLVYCGSGNELRLTTTTPRESGNMFALLLECTASPPLSPAERQLYGRGDGGAQ